MERITKLFHALSHLTRTDWAFIRFKVALGLMLVVPLSQLDTVQRSTNAPFIVAWLLVTVLGFFISVTGLVMSAQKYTTRREGFRIELAGLWLLLAGPLVFALIQLGLALTTGRNSAASIAVCIVIAAAVHARMIMVKAAAKSRTVVYRYIERNPDDRE